MAKLRNYRNWGCLILLLLLSGCGFHLKGYHQASTALDGLFVLNADQRGSLAEVIQRDLQTSGAALAASAEQAKHLLHIRSEEFKRRVISVDASGKVLEYELRLESGFSVKDAEGGEIVPDQPLEMIRHLVFSGEDELGRRSEEALLRADMRSDLANQVIRRLEVLLK